MFGWSCRLLWGVVPLVTLVSVDSVYSQTVSSTNLTCSSSKKLQAAINAVPSGTVGTINVSGTCNENIVVPRGKTIIIRGATATSRLTAANASSAALLAQGDVTIQRMTVTNAAGSAETLVSTDREGFLEIVSSDLSAPNVESVVSIANGSGRVINSRVIGGTFAAVEGWGSSTLVIKADPKLASGPTGKAEIYIKSAGNAVNCAQGASVNIRAFSNASSSGLVNIDQSGAGISTNNCDLTVFNSTGSKANLTIGGNTVGLSLSRTRGVLYNIIVKDNVENGLALGQSDLEIFSSEVTGNGSWGMTAGQSRVQIGDVLFNNAGGDIGAGTLSSVEIYAWRGQSSFPKALTWDNSFNCWSGSRIDIESGALLQTLGTQYDFRGCLYQN